jgi:predicted NodU family carbamoyl transferase
MRIVGLSAFYHDSAEALIESRPAGSWRPRRRSGSPALLEQFRELTGCPVLVNTSFNVRGEPIVCTPEDAFRCFMGTDIERLVVGNALISKEQQDPALCQDYKGAFELD